MTWSLVTYRRGDATAVAVLRADGILVAPADLKRWPTMLELLEDWRQAEGNLRGLEVEVAPVVDHDALLAPVRWPAR